MLWFRNDRFGGSLRLADNDSSPLQLLIILDLHCLLLLDFSSFGLSLNTIFDDVPDLVNEELSTGNVEGGCFLWRLSYLKMWVFDISYHIDFRVIEIGTIECLLVLSLPRVPYFYWIGHVGSKSLLWFFLLN